MGVRDGQWSLRIGATRLQLTLARAGLPAARSGPRTARWLEQLIAEGLRGDDPTVRRVLLEVAESMLGSAGWTWRRHASRVAEALLQAADEGRVGISEEVPVATGLLSPGDLIDPWGDEPVAPPEPEPELAWFEVRVVDEVGDPIADLRMSVTIEHLTQTVTTDADGVARVDDVDASDATAEVTVPQELRDIVTPRWAQPRAPVVPESTADAPVHVEQLDEHFDPIPLQRRKRALLVIIPRFACREVDAITYDFGKSFVRRQGIPSLAAIAQELHQDDGQQAMIFGHTDRSGSEALNKRLSERRGKAVFAIFTHDFEAWEDMWRARVNEHPWWERWGTREVQHMLNALECRDDDDEVLGEDGSKGSRTNQAIRRFKRGDYPRKPDEQAGLPDDSQANEAFRRELFFAYAKLVTRDPVDAARFVPVGGSPFMGCGEYNPLSLEARDEESRRTVVFVFDPAAAPQDPPCAIGDVGPCRAILDEPPPAETEDGEPNPGPFYRCQYYQQVATCCRSVGGPDLAHDVIVRFFMPLADANALPHRFILEAEDEADEDDDDEPGFAQPQALGADARAYVPEEEDADDDDADDDDADDDDANDDDADDDDPYDDLDDDDDADADDDEPPAAPLGEMCEIHFTHVPDAHAYRLRVEGVDEPYAVFVRTRFHQISELSAPAGLTRFPRLNAILNPPPPPPPEPPPPDPANPAPTPTPTPTPPGGGGTTP
ncbi:MAG: OmpA family protein [Nannocystaceae bacterium]